MEWLPIDEDTPKDEPIIVFAPGFAKIPDLVCLCQWHADAGFTVCELREPTHWMPFNRPDVP